MSQRIDDLQRLWDRIAEREQDVEVTDAQRAELDRRLADHEADPDGCVPWESVLKRLRAKR